MCTKCPAWAEVCALRVILVCCWYCWECKKACFWSIQYCYGFKQVLQHYCFSLYFSFKFPWLHWHYWLSRRKGIRPLEINVGMLVVIWLEPLHVLEFQLAPLPPPSSHAVAEKSKMVQNFGVGLPRDIEAETRPLMIENRRFVSETEFWMAAVMGILPLFSGVSCRCEKPYPHFIVFVE